MTSPRDVVFPAGRQALYEQNRYSPAIRSNGFLFVSGQVGSRPDGSPEHDLPAQVRLAFQNLNSILEAAGCSFKDVIDVTVFMVNPEQNFEVAGPWCRSTGAKHRTPHSPASASPGSSASSSRSR